jgi:pimeloyl-ACP methyl ester carboxylesterase
MGPTSHFFFSQRLRLHYVDWGNSEAPPVLLVHGGQDHCRNWDAIAADLCQDYHVIAPDLRGHGDSAWCIGGGYTLADFVFDLAQLVRQKTDVPISLIAHSLGGAISLLYAGLFPALIEHLIIIEGTWQFQMPLEPIESRVPDWIETIYALTSRLPRQYKTIDQAMGRMKEKNPFLTDDQARHLTIHGMIQNENGTYSWKFDNFTRAISPHRFAASEILSMWSCIRAPTLLIHGSESWLGDPRENGLMDKFTNAGLMMIEGAGHWPHHNETDKVIAALRSFLNQPLPSPASNIEKTV